LKPSLFTNELLAIADPLYTVIFEGLWCAADREGRLEDRPAKIHMAVNPGRAFEGTDRSLNWLNENRFIERYVVDGIAYIQVLMFWKHQNPHFKESPSVIPKAPGFSSTDEGKASGFSPTDDTKASGKPEANGHESDFHEGKARLIPDSGFLIPSSLIPDSGSLIPDSHPLDGYEGKKPRAKRSAATRIPDGFELTDLRRAYAESKGVDPEPTFEAFCAYWRNRPKDAEKLNWDLTWHSWVLKDAKDTKQRNAPKPTRYDQIQAMRNGR
jgi:hypothetical protein